MSRVLNKSKAIKRPRVKNTCRVLKSPRKPTDCNCYCFHFIWTSNFETTVRTTSWNTMHSFLFNTIVWNSDVNKEDPQAKRRNEFLSLSTEYLLWNCRHETFLFPQDNISFYSPPPSGELLIHTSRVSWEAQPRTGREPEFQILNGFVVAIW